jgi:RES domain-containing protein
VLTVFRISGKSYSPNDPTGAALSSEGRWHKKGQRVLYFCNSLSTCVLELRANGVSYKTIREQNHFCEAKIPDSISIEEVPRGFYSDGWRVTKDKAQEFGAKWYLENRTLILRVKSAVIATEFNLVINTNHPEFHKIEFSKPASTDLDPRLQENEDSDKHKK